VATEARNEGGSAVVRLYVPLRREEVNRIVQLAQAERRRPADQAAYIIAQWLEQTTTPAQTARPAEPVAAS
jgi:hypothetical protein